MVLDSNGDEVEIPAEVTKAAPLIGAFAQMTEMLTAGSGKISAAATNNISDYFKKVFPDYLVSNPNNYNSSSVEELIASGTQVAYGPGSIFSEEQLAQLKAAGIAFVAINNIRNVDGMCESFEIIGSVLGKAEEARAAEFVSYYRGNIASASGRVSGVAEADKVKFLSLFYSADSYTTINGGDICNEYIEAEGGVNLAKDYVSQAASNSLTVDAEQIVAWNPQVIMTSNQSGKEKILSDPALATVDAVVNRRVHVAPYGIYLWSVRSGEGAMLPLWLGTIMYPELFSDVNMTQVVKDFFNNFYNYDISDAEIQAVLAGDVNTGMTR
jgi:iron complex transport system substrate-binding protein